MNWYTTNYAVGGFVAIVVGAFVLGRGNARRLTRHAWFGLCLCVGVWHIGKFFLLLTHSESWAYLAVHLIYLAAIVIPPSYLHFILALLAEERIKRGVLITAYCLALAEYALLISGSLIAGVSYLPLVGFYEIPGGAYWLYVGSYILIPSFAMYRLVTALRVTEGAVKKNQLKYVIYSSLIGFVAGLTSFLPIFSGTWPPFGAPIVYFYTLPITYAIARYRLLDIDVVIKKSVIYAVLLLALLLPCYALVIFGQKMAFGIVNYEFSLGTLVILIVVGFFFPKLRFRTEEALERVLFRKRTRLSERVRISTIETMSRLDCRSVSR